MDPKQLRERLGLLKDVVDTMPPSQFYLAMDRLDTQARRSAECDELRGEIWDLTWFYNIKYLIRFFGVDDKFEGIKLDQCFEEQGRDIVLVPAINDLFKSGATDQNWRMFRQACVGATLEEVIGLLVSEGPKIWVTTPKEGDVAECLASIQVHKKGIQLHIGSRKNTELWIPAYAFLAKEDALHTGKVFATDEDGDPMQLQADELDDFLSGRPVDVEFIPPHYCIMMKVILDGNNAEVNALELKRLNDAPEYVLTEAKQSEILKHLNAELPNAFSSEKVGDGISRNAASFRIIEAEG